MGLASHPLQPSPETRQLPGRGARGQQPRPASLAAQLTAHLPLSSPKQSRCSWALSCAGNELLKQTQPRKGKGWKL